MDNSNWSDWTGIAMAVSVVSLVVFLYLTGA
jgi:hypothetical protein